jgi:hypothetical protein
MIVKVCELIVIFSMCISFTFVAWCLQRLSFRARMQMRAHHYRPLPDPRMSLWNDAETTTSADSTTTSCGRAV